MSLLNERKLEKGERESIYKDLSEDKKFELITNIVDNKKIDDMVAKNYIPYHYNGSYGGSGKSQSMRDAVRIILKFLEKDDCTDEEKELQSKFKYPNVLKCDFLNAIIQAKTIDFLGEKACRTQYSNPVYDFVDLKYYMYINKNEYDGLESLEFDLYRYHSEKTKEILKLDLTNEEKLEKITEVVNSEPDPIDYLEE